MNGVEHLAFRLVYGLLDGQLDATAESAAQAHVLQCEPCRRLERECSGVVESLHSHGHAPVKPHVGYWDEFSERWSHLSETGHF